MKKIKKTAIILICITAALFIAFSLFTRSPKGKIIKMVKNNMDEYTSVAENFIENGKDSSVTLNGVKDISVYDSVQVDFTCRYSGIVPASGYYGFYYSKDDKPRGFQEQNISFEKDGRGLSWQQSGGDNRCYVEKIADYWYYFEMHF